MLTTFVLLAALLVAVSALASAVVDTLSHHYSTSVFSRFNPLFWNPELSWRNKYKNGDHTAGPKFFLSTTLFVVFTDAWHLFKSVRENSWQMAAALIFSDGLPWWWLVIAFAAIKALYWPLFHFPYTKGFRE